MEDRSLEESGRNPPRSFDDEGFFTLYLTDSSGALVVVLCSASPGVRFNP